MWSEMEPVLSVYAVNLMQNQSEVVSAKLECTNST